MKNNRSNNAVSEIIGTVLLLLIAISAMSVIYINVLSEDGPNPNTIVKIIGHGEGQYIYLEHNGGENINLNNELSYSIAGDTLSTATIGELIYEDKEPYNVWNLGEQLKIPINYNLDKLDEFQIAEITGIDTESNSMIFHGPVTLPQPVSDTGLDVSVFDVNGSPIQGGDTLLINITITSYGGDVNGSGGVTVRYKIPNGLTYITHYSPSGHNDEYNITTGYWNSGNIMEGYDNRSILTIKVKVNESLGRIPTQLGLIIDGSGSIENEWGYYWTQSSDKFHAGSFSAKSDENHDGYFECNELNTSDANNITIDFSYMLYDDYGTVEEDDLILECYDGTQWNKIHSLGGKNSDEWINNVTVITNPQYFNPNFKIRFFSSLYAGYGSDSQYHNEMVWIDDVVINKDTETLLKDGFEGDTWNWFKNWQPSDWDLIKIGLANAILNSSIFPQDGSVELTVIQFGTELYEYYGYSEVEINPTRIVDFSTAKDVTDDIVNITQGIAGTPMAGGIYLATDQLNTSDNFNESHRQSIILITDGVPNYCSSRPFSNYPNGPYPSSYCSEENDAKNSAVVARDDAINKLNMSENLDEFDCLAVGVGGMYGAPDVDWLNGSIVWPNPYIWEIQSPNSFSGPGWVSTIDSFEQFEFAMSEMFKAIFSLQSTVEYVGSTTYDPNDSNNQATIIIG